MNWRGPEARWDAAYEMTPQPSACTMMFPIDSALVAADRIAPVGA